MDTLDIKTSLVLSAASVGKPTIPEVVPLVIAYYAKPGNEAGGNLHIVLDDGNVEDGAVRFCLERAASAGDVDGAHLAGLLLRMSKTQRAKLRFVTP